MAALRILRHLSPNILESALSLVLPIYPWLRPRQVRRLRACFAASPFKDQLSLTAYYQTRLRLFLRGLNQHGRPIATGSVTVSGTEHYQEALDSRRPIALVGLHTGLLELLHRVPNAPDDRPFLILTAPAFAPPLTGFMAEGRKREGKNIIWNGLHPVGTTIGKELTAGLRAIAKSKGVLALMADQNPIPSANQDYLRLWDKIEVAYPARLLGFLCKQNFQFVPVSTKVMPDGTSTFLFHPIWKPEATASGNLPTMDEGGLRSRLRTFLEASIAAAPEQWNWSYPKIRPSRS